MNEKQNHSKLGIFSCLIAVGVWIYLTIMTLLLWKTDYFERFFDKFLASNRGGMVNGFEDFGTAILFLFFLVGVIPVVGHLLGFILGIIGSFSRRRNRTFAVIGVCLNVLPFAILLILNLFGSS